MHMIQTFIIVIALCVFRLWEMNPVLNHLTEVSFNADTINTRTDFAFPTNRVGDMTYDTLQYIPRNMHTVFALLCFVVVTYWLIFPYPSGLLHWHCGNLASKATLMNMDKYFMWIHYERLHNHNKAKHNKTVCIFLGIYCRYNIYESWRHDMDGAFALLTLYVGSPLVTIRYPIQGPLIQRFDVFFVISLNKLLLYKLSSYRSLVAMAVMCGHCSVVKTVRNVSRYGIITWKPRALWK